MTLVDRARVRYKAFRVAVETSIDSIRASLSNPTDQLLRAMTNNGFYKLSKGSAGIVVNERTALTLPAYFGAIKIIAESVGQLPLELYRRTDLGKEKARDHHLYELLHLRPHPYIGSSVLRETTTGHATSHGMGYWFINRRRGRIESLAPMLPDRTEPVWPEPGVMKIKTRDDQGNHHTYDPADVVVFVGLGFDGFRGYSLFEYFRDTISGAKAQQEYTNLFFANGSHIGGVVRHPKRMKDDASLKRLKSQLDEKQKGLGKSHELMILEDGMEYQKIGVSPSDAQAIELNNYSLLDFCRITRIPPHMLAYLADATFSNVEEMGIEFLKFTLAPILVRQQQEMTYKLLTKDERAAGLFVAYNLNGYLMGDAKARSEYYHQMIGDGVFNADEVRELENMNLQPDGLGKKYYVAVNWVEKGTNPYAAGRSQAERLIAHDRRSALPDPGEVSRTVSLRRVVASGFAGQFRFAYAVILEDETAAIRAAIEEHLPDSVPAFRTWLDEYYAEWEAEVAARLAPAVTGLSDAILPFAKDEANSTADIDAAYQKFRAAYLENAGVKYAISSRAQLKDVLNAAEASMRTDDEILPADAVLARLDQWEGSRADRETRRQVTAARNAFSRAAFQACGVRTIEWVAGEDEGPYCRALDGSRVLIDSLFLAKGSRLQPEGVEEPLVVTRNIGHPPLDGDCDCDIRPV